MEGRLRSGFIGPNGIRAGWRLLIWAATLILSVAILRQIVGWAIDHFHFNFPDGISAPEILVQDGVAMIAVLLATLVMRRIEHRSLAEYGIETRQPFNHFFWAGILWGIASPAAVIGLMWILHGYSPGSLALHGPSLFKYAAVWAITCILLGFAEEYVFRGYPLFTLSTAIGFWPAALLLSLGFGAIHYFTKPFERWTDFATTGLLALFMCLALRRTGSLSFAIGFHITFDYANIFVISGPNAGQYAVGKLLNATFAGPAWLTGGPLGPEASLLIFPVIAAMFFLFDRTYRTANFPLRATSSRGQNQFPTAVASSSRS